MDSEIFVDIKGYGGKYQISNLGRVWSVKNQRYLKINDSTYNGYPRVMLYALNGKAKKERVHRLVALAFVPNPNNLPYVNHKDEDRTNFKADNLEWCDAKYNNNYGRHNQRLKESKQGGKC